MYLLGCLGYLLYYLLREYRLFHIQSHQKQIELQNPKTQNFSNYIEIHRNDTQIQWNKLHKSPFSETNW